MDIKECTEQNEIRTLRPEQIDRKRAVLSLRARLIFLLFVKQRKVDSQNR